MKKKLTVTIVSIFLALTLFAGGVYAGTQYIDWAGSEDYYQTLENLNLIADKGEQIKSDRDDLYRENEQLNNTILDKDNQIDSLEQDIIALEERIDGEETTQSQLEQAIEDMAGVENKSSDVLNGLGGND